MRSVLQIGTLLLILLVTLTACTAPSLSAAVPTITPTLTARQQVVESAPNDQVTLASGQYQLLMFYSPL